MMRKLRKRLHMAMLIREAIENYPDGICFSASGGRPILSNKKINDICYQLTGHTVTNADRIWEELQNGKMPDVVPDLSGESHDNVEQILYRLQDGQIWQFQRRQLTLESGTVTQYEAADVTDLYRYGTQLVEKNEELSGMLERQRVLLQNIVENNLKKELLYTKMRIHSDFGRLLVMTKNRLLSAEENEEDSGIFQAWENVITDMENASTREETVTASPQNELLRIAEMIGCKVEFIGEQPQERKALLLLYAAIREALTNAVRHAGADRLTVEIEHVQGSCEVTITGNGRRDAVSIREGGGLSDLRRRLEQEGGALRMEINEGVVIHVTIPEGVG